MKRVGNFPFFPVNLNPEPEKVALVAASGLVAAERAGGVVLEESGPIVFDGILSSLYEPEIKEIVGNKKFYLSVTVKGEAWITLFRRDCAGHVTTYKKVMTQLDPEAPEARITAELSFNFPKGNGSQGRWFFSVDQGPSETSVEILDASWGVHDADVTAVHPAFVICTFNREEQMKANVGLLTETLSQCTDGFHIYVVDNASNVKRCDTWGDEITLVPQRNVGGAGGFGRGIYEALSRPEVSHIVMLDDDADVDQHSIIRMMNLFKLSRNDDVFIGGMQLDAYDPMTMADAGAFWLPDGFERPHGRLPPSRMDRMDVLDRLSGSHYGNFNGWWLFGGAAKGFRKHGMPLPCFVHLDDVDYGVRIDLQGGRVLSVPGIAVWHEPYYAKPEGWFAYYNIRNELIRLSAHAPMLYRSILDVDTPAVDAKIESHARRALRRTKSRLRHRMANFLRSYQYGSAMLVVKAVEDFLKGPAVLMERDPEELHKEVMSVYKAYNGKYKFSVHPPKGMIASGAYDFRNASGLWGLNKYLNMLDVLLREITGNGNLTTRSSRSDVTAYLTYRQRRVTVFPAMRDMHWKRVKPGRSWSYLDPAGAGYHIYKVDVAAYDHIRKAMRAAIQKFDAQAANVTGEWSDAYEEMTSEKFWAGLVERF